MLIVACKLKTPFNLCALSTRRACTTLREYSSNDYRDVVLTGIAHWCIRMRDNPYARQVWPFVVLFAGTIYAHEVLDGADTLLEKVQAAIGALYTLGFAVALISFVYNLLFVSLPAYTKETRSLNEFQAFVVGGLGTIALALQTWQGEAGWGGLCLRIAGWALWIWIAANPDRVSRWRFNFLFALAIGLILGGRYL